MLEYKKGTPAKQPIFKRNMLLFKQIEIDDVATKVCTKKAWKPGLDIDSSLQCTESIIPWFVTKTFSKLPLMGPAA